MRKLLKKGIAILIGAVLTAAACIGTIDKQ